MPFSKFDPAGPLVRPENRAAIAALPNRSPLPEGPTELFISYKRSLRARVEQLVEIFRALRIHVWFDGDLAPGESYLNAIGQKVREASCVLVCWSRDAFFSGGDVNAYVSGEAMIAHERGVLVPVLLEPVTLDPPWNTIHTESLVGWFSEDALGSEDAQSWLDVLAAIGRKIGRPGLSDYARASSRNSADALLAWADAFPEDPLVELARARAAVMITEAGPRRSAPAAQASADAVLIEGAANNSATRGRGRSSGVFGLASVAIMAAALTLALVSLASPGFRTDAAPLVSAVRTAAGDGLDHARELAHGILARV